MKDELLALRAENERLKRKLDKKVLWGDGVRIILGEVSMQLHYKLAHTDKDGCVEWPCREVGYYLSRDEERCLKHRTDRAAAALKKKAMTKDELEAAATAIAIARGRYWENTREDIIELAQAHTEAALADTLGMLEALAKGGGDPVYKGLQVNYCPETDSFTYLRRNDHLKWRGIERTWIDLSRAEAEALLGKGQ